jgi:F0F1-type ATP synthase membrane subunit b/b'
MPGTMMYPDGGGLTAAARARRERVLRSAAQQWSRAARAAPAEVEARHPESGALGALEIIRRNAHEAHHQMDIKRSCEP